MDSTNIPRYTIIDEADEMVGPDWIDDMRGILGGGTFNKVKTDEHRC